MRIFLPRLGPRNESPLRRPSQSHRRQACRPFRPRCGFDACEPQPSKQASGARWLTQLGPAGESLQLGGLVMFAAERYTTHVENHHLYFSLFCMVKLAVYDVLGLALLHITLLGLYPWVGWFPPWCTMLHDAALIAPWLLVVAWSGIPSLVAIYGMGLAMGRHSIRAAFAFNASRFDCGIHALR